jgi:Zn-dependent metalloprotease
MNFNRFAMSRKALGLYSALLLMGVSPAWAQNSGSDQNASIINFPANSELRGADAAALLTNRLQLRNGIDEIRSAFIQNPGDGLQVQRFHQYFKGLRVAHGSYTLTSKDEMPSYAFGKFYAVPANFSIAPAIDEKAALASAMKEIGATTYSWEMDPAQYPKGHLELCEDFRLENMTGDLHLAWVFEVRADAPLSANTMYVDAKTGKVLLADAIIKHVAAKGASLYSDTVNFQAAQSGSVFTMNDVSRGGGVVTANMNFGTNPYVSFNSFPVISNTSATFLRDPSVDAQWGATIVYDYWKGTHNRLSYDGANAPLYSLVHYSTNYANAFWSGDRMVYGDGSPASGMGPLTSLDVCAHEIGHGVCQETAQLVYNRESGAMNEGFSDIWGAVIEKYGDPLERDAKAKDMWLIGEELATAPFRSMREPKQYGQPDTYQGNNWVNANTQTCNSVTNDNCGVHTNSGVLNKWFFLLTDGGTATNDLNDYYKVAGLGMVKSARIAYATELTLNRSATYAACRTASIAAAATLYGACSKEVESVTRAWFAVGVGADYTAACTPQIAFESGVTKTLSENVSINDCKPSKLINVPVALRGTTALAGDSVTVTATVIGGNAVAGVDYSLTTASTSFLVGGATTANLGITVYDNGYVNASKYIDLKLSINARGSNAALAYVGDSVRVTIADNEKAPDLGVTESREVLAPAATAGNGSPFAGGSLNARSQYIYRPFELLAAGVIPNVPISSLEFNMLSVSSTDPYDNYTVKIGNSTVGSLNSGWITSGLSTVYTGSYSVIFGMNQIPFSTPFVWNGTDNVVVEVCFSNTTLAGAINDRVSSSFGPQFLTSYATSATVSGCALTYVAANQNNQRPVLFLNQDVPGASVETASGTTRTWNIPASREAYFYSNVNEKLMIGINSASDSLGCVTANVAAAGAGFDNAQFGTKLSRSKKEFIINGTATPASMTYNGILYYTNAELGGHDPKKVRILWTSSTSDAGINSTNSREIKVDEVIEGTDYRGFRGRFSAYGRYFLIDTMVNANLSVGGTASQQDDMWTGANPFSNYPELNWSLNRPEQVSIRLMDITGKLVYSNSTRLEAGTSKLELRASNALAPGTYIMQVIRPNGVFTRQLVKH